MVSASLIGRTQHTTCLHKGSSVLLLRTFNNISELLSSENLCESGSSNFKSVFASCVLALISTSICFCVCGLTATSTLSAQSAPSVYPPQQAFLGPGGMIDGGSSPLLQSFKPSPSNENLCSAYTSDATLSAPSLCVTSQGKNKVTHHSPSAFF